MGNPDWRYGRTESRLFKCQFYPGLTGHTILDCPSVLCKMCGEEGHISAKWIALRSRAFAYEAPGHTAQYCK